MATLADLETGLIHWWSMDQSSGLRVDHIGSSELSNNGASGTPGLGGRGGAVLFDASNNEYLSATSVGTQNDTLSVGSGDFTINFFVRLDDVSILQQWILGKNASYGHGGGEYDVSFSSDVFTVTWNGDSTTFTLGSSANDGDWFMVTIYKDNTDSVYGITVNANSTPAEAGFSTQNRSNHDFRIGGFASGSNNLEGAIDEVGFWNRKLSQDEMDLLVTFWDDNNYAPTYTDIIGIPATISASDFNDPCSTAIDCCRDLIKAYDALAALGDTPDCPTDVIITFDPPPGGRVNLPGYVVLIETNSPTGVIRYSEYGMEPNAASTIYTGPVEIDSVGGGISAKIFYEDCPPSRTFSVRHRSSKTENLAYIFSYFCATADQAGTWDIFTADGLPDNHWNLVLDASASVTINRIDLYQLDSNGQWTTGIAWSTTEFIYPYPGEPTKDFRALPLVADDGSQINSDYDTPNPLITFSGTKTIDLYGQIVYPAADFFKVEIHMSTGKVLYSIISFDDCQAGGGPSNPCVTPAAPGLTPGCSLIAVEFSMTVNHQYRIFVKSDCDELGFILMASGTVGTDPQTVNITGLEEGCNYQIYVSQWDNTAGCDYIDSDISTATPLKTPAGTITALPAVIKPGDPVTVAWDVDNVTGVTITSDDVAFNIGATTPDGSQTFDPGPTANNCWHLSATNTCGTLLAEACITVIPLIASACPDPKLSFYTCQEVAANGTFATFGPPTFGICGTNQVFSPDWNGILPLGATQCGWDTTGSGIVINNQGRRVQLTVSIVLVPSTHWLFSFHCSINGNLLWKGIKTVGLTPDGIYTRTDGDYSGPATLTII